MENIFFRVCVFCDVLLFEQGCAFFVKNDCVFLQRERDTKKPLFFIFPSSSSRGLFFSKPFFWEISRSLSLGSNPTLVKP